MKVAKDVGAGCRGTELDGCRGRWVGDKGWGAMWKTERKNKRQIRDELFLVKTSILAELIQNYK